MEKLAIIEQRHNANDNRARAGILLRCPDSILLKYEPVFVAACRPFEAGQHFVTLRCELMHAVRTAAGGLPGGKALELETLRAEMAAYAAGMPVAQAKEYPPPIDL